MSWLAADYCSGGVEVTLRVPADACSGPGVHQRCICAARACSIVKLGIQNQDSDSHQEKSHVAVTVGAPGSGEISHLSCLLHNVNITPISMHAALELASCKLICAIAVIGGCAEEKKNPQLLLNFVPQYQDGVVEGGEEEMVYCESGGSYSASQGLPLPGL